MIEYVTNRLEVGLRNLKIGEAPAAAIARSIMAEFERSGTYLQLATCSEADVAIDFALAAFQIGRQSSIDFTQAVAISLPPKAPEIWRARDRSKRETPIAFLNRVWGPYMRAGVLYQCDIKRLGDPMLMQAVRNYCIRHNMKAADVLPPPMKVRLERALATATPGSLESAYYKQRLRSRRSSVAAKRRRRAPAP